MLSNLGAAEGIRARLRQLDHPEAMVDMDLNPNRRGELDGVGACEELTALCARSLKHMCLLWVSRYLACEYTQSVLVLS